MATILIVDDMETNREIMSRVLQRDQYDCIFAEDGQQAIENAQEKMPDLILLDMGLPIIDGWEAARQIRANQKTKDIPIIAITAHAMTNDRKKAFDAGCNDYLTKPIDFKSLSAAVNKILKSEG